ncbi:MAG: hypothetical protein ACXVRE_12045, partial [Gaiellaceae bacterium]
MESSTIVVLEGDETGQELLEEALRVLQPEVVGLELQFPRFDLSLASRRATEHAIVQRTSGVRNICDSLSDDDIRLIERLSDALERSHLDFLQVETAGLQ